MSKRKRGPHGRFASPPSIPEALPAPLDPGPMEYPNAMEARGWNPPTLEVRRSVARALQGGLDVMFEDLQSAEYSIKRLQERLDRAQELEFRYRGFMENLRRRIKGLTSKELTPTKAIDLLVDVLNALDVLIALEHP